MKKNKLVAKRVQEEYDALRKRTGNLEATVDNFDNLPQIPEEHKKLLTVQLHIMRQYLEILEKRLKLFEQDSK